MIGDISHKHFIYMTLKNNIQKTPLLLTIIIPAKDSMLPPKKKRTVILRLSQLFFVFREQSKISQHT